MDTLSREIARILTEMGMEQDSIDWSTRLILIAGVALVTCIATQAFRHLVMPAIQKITAKTKATWDDYLFNAQMLKGFSRMIPPIMLYILMPFAFEDMPHFLDVLLKACTVYLIVMTLMLINSFLNSLYEISNEHESLRNRPLKGIYQMINLIAIGIGIIIIISVLIDQDATTILAGLGASAAVLMLVFKDSILGLVAGVQLSANDMLRPGDWITMPKYGADGDVMEVSLTTVKVRNFDKTITTIPPYALVSDSFQNWRGMRETGGRRIKRSVYIDMGSVRFCSAEEIDRFIARGWLDKGTDGTKRPVVNLQVFRDYLQDYLRNHPEVHKELMVMVRQMQPTPEGLPLEIYCFSNTVVWPEYERIQGEIFDHLLAVISEFGLRVFQRPSGNDFNGTNFKQTAI